MYIRAGVHSPIIDILSVLTVYSFRLQDCNGDGNIDCDDFVRIHRLGGYGCTGPFNSKYENTYKLCMKTFGNL